MAADQAANRPATDLLRRSRQSGGGTPQATTVGGSGARAAGSPGGGAAEIDGITQIELVAEGASSRLFRGRQAIPPRAVAVKVLQAELSSDIGQRFDRERMIIGELSGHSAVVPVFGCGLTGGGDPYLLMPWYERGSLARLAAEHGRLGWREAAFLIEPIAVTLAEVHGRGLVHRNLKPANILLTDFLLPRVGDFGLCLPVGERSTPATIAPAHFYSPPELAAPTEADPRADVYGLGAMLWALVSGQATFEGYTAAVDARAAAARARMQQLGPGEAAVPDAIGELIARSMAADPHERPANAAAFVNELRRGAATANRARASVGTTRPPVLNLTDDPTSVATAVTPAPPAASVDESTSPSGTAASSADAPSPGTRARVEVSETIKADARYVLILVASIMLVIVAMVTAALMP